MLQAKALAVVITKKAKPFTLIMASSASSILLYGRMVQKKARELPEHDSFYHTLVYCVKASY
jgi:hypothetical protein